jgi:hypothetical protein
MTFAIVLTFCNHATGPRINAGFRSPARGFLNCRGEITTYFTIICNVQYLIGWF